MKLEKFITNYPAVTRVIISCFILAIGLWWAKSFTPEPWQPDSHKQYNPPIYNSPDVVSNQQSNVISGKVLKDTTIIIYRYSAPTYSRSNNIINERALDKHIRNYIESNPDILENYYHDYHYDSPKD